MNLSPLNEKMLHGGDYNPDQWLDRPDILKQDIVLMKEAHVNCVSVAIFAWAQLEPQEGVYDFGWLGRIIGQLYENGIYTILATPTGARPAWMAQKYPEVLRVDSSLHRNHMGERHNHCYTSPVYREKARQINVRLSQAFGKHPGRYSLAYFQRIRRRVLLRAVPGGLPSMAQGEVPDTGSPKPCLVDRLLEPYLH